jgi:hypothetical protein
MGTEISLVLSSGRVLVIQYTLTFGDIFIILLLLALASVEVARLAMRK